VLSYLILGITYAFAASVQPGPFQTFLISKTLSNGLKSTFPAAFAPLLSDGPIILLVLFVLSQMPVWLAQGLQCAGGIFLLYLAWGAFKNWRNNNTLDTIKNQAGGQTALRAAIVNFLNPNPWLAWSLVMGPLLLKGWRETPFNGIALLVGFYTTMILVAFGIMLVFGAARNLGTRVSRILLGISAIAMAGFGFYELWSGLKVILPI
jgi:threonine/homoserine/homoserine lactone efflux protein